MKISAILAGFWLLVGATLLVADPQELQVRVGGQSYSAGWVALLLAAWNLVRWWSVRSSGRQQRASDEAARRRERARREREVPPEERNPDFQFEDPPTS